MKENLNCQQSKAILWLLFVKKDVLRENGWSRTQKDIVCIILLFDCTLVSCYCLVPIDNHIHVYFFHFPCPWFFKPQNSIIILSSCSVGVHYTNASILNHQLNLKLIIIIIIIIIVFPLEERLLRGNFFLIINLTSHKN